MSIAIGIIALLITLVISIALHEAGHMVAARKLGISVPRYFIGFGPTIWSKKKNGTEYGFKALPLGGFVDISDLSQPEESVHRKLLTYVSPWKRIVVFLAGPMVNLILGFTILIATLMIFPSNQISTTVSSVNACGQAAIACGASQAGILPEDKILKVGDTVVNENDLAVSQATYSHKGESVDIVVSRNGSETTIKNVKVDSNGKIGIGLKIVKKPLSFTESIGIFSSIWNQTIDALINIPSNIANVWGALWGTEQREQSGLSSIVGVGSAYVNASETAQSDTEGTVSTWFLYGALLNLGLFFGNLLPFAPLDGGKILLAGIDLLRQGFSKIFRRKYTPLSVNAVVSFSVVTAAMVIPVMLLLIIGDIFVPLSY